MTSVRTQPEWAPDGGSQEAPRPGYRRRVAADRTLRIELLGGFRVSLGERAVPATEWRRSKAASLVKLLALAQGHRLHREQAMDVLWPDLAPAAAAANLRKTIHYARRAIAADEGAGLMQASAVDGPARLMLVRGRALRAGCRDARIQAKGEARRDR
jgi:hypothetical protein